jgi:two-component system CheB/CheR fusion protein
MGRDAEGQGDDPAATEVTPQPLGAAFPIAGVGASAGGLDAFSRLLGALPPKLGIALILVQHLDPKQHSMLADILGRASKMPVVEASNGMRIEPDHIYVMPQNASIRVSGASIVLGKRPKSTVHQLPIDTLFKSLAEERGRLAIGVVLSGTGSDGVAGLSAIRDAGGLAYAQDPATAEYDGMPRAAEDAGVVDASLDIAGIAAELVRLGADLAAAPGSAPSETSPDLEEAALRGILTLMRDRVGLDLASYRKTTLLRRINRRMLLEDVSTMRDYVAALKKNPARLEILYQDILINTTQFFRDPAALESLKRKVFPEILTRRASDGPVRIWVPGCSKGQEAYSILIALIEFLDDAGEVEVQMFASDVNERDVEFARAGVYPQGIATEVSPERLSRFFVQVPGGYQISRSVREMCVFATHDVTKDPPFSRLDLVSLRNVLIYMERPLQERVLQVLHYALEPGGFLLLGSSETVGTESSLFATVDKKNRIFKRKPGPASLLAASGRTLGIGRSSQSLRQDPTQGFDVFAAADIVVRGKYQLAGLLLGPDLEVLQFRGEMAPYLAPVEGPSELRLSRLVAPGLASAVEAAVREAANQQAPAHRRGSVAVSGGGRLDVDIEVVPILSPSGETYYLAFFEAAGGERASQAPKKAKRDSSQTNEESLERELDETRSQLEAAISQREAANSDLRVFNERLQASNEELRTTNEEFQTAQEELQSTNEELTTLNDELRNRNTELTRLADDLHNVIDGVELPILILSADLCIRRFTPQAGAIVNIQPTDVGRPLSDLSLKVEVADLTRAARDVMVAEAPSESEVRGAGGQWYLMRIRPYRTNEGTVDGVVVAFVEISELKRNRELAEVERRHAEAVLQTVRQPLLTLAPDHTVQQANDAYLHTFGVEVADVVGLKLFELGGGQWDAPELSASVRKLISKTSDFSGVEIDREFPGIGRRIMRVDGLWVQEEAGQGSLLIAIEDVTIPTRRQRLTTALNDIGVTLAAVDHMDSVLGELLRESAEALGCDSAALLLRQQSSWVLKAAHGLSKGLADVQLDEDALPVAVESLRSGEPVLLRDGSEAVDFVSGLGVDLERRSVLLVPIMSRGEPVGSFSFHFQQPALIFTEAEDDFGRRLGTLTGLALEAAELYQEQKEIAETLQAALSTAPRRLAGVEFGYLYRSATKASTVGGDFFDLFELEGDRVGILIGDVSGKGVKAATLTSLVKNSIRALAYEHESPAEILTKISALILKSTTAFSFVTLVFCVLDTVTGYLTYANAGHTEGIIRRTDGGIDRLLVHSPLAGAFSNTTFAQGDMTLTAGDLLVLYTDGVTEARRDGEMFGIERLSAFIEHLSDVRPRPVASAIFDEVHEYAGGALSDDVAIVTVGLSPR